MSSVNNILSSPVGIDDTIQAFQNDLYTELSSVWSGDIAGYGKIYKNRHSTREAIPEWYRSSKIYIPEWYNATKDDYESVYYDDNYGAVFCFLISDRDTTNDSIVYNSTVKIVFMVDLNKIYPSDSERVDEKAHRDVIEICRNFSYSNFQINGIQRGIETIFNGYTTTDIKFDDTHPLHSFAVVVDLQYTLTDKCL